MNFSDLGTLVAAIAGFATLLNLLIPVVALVVGNIFIFQSLLRLKSLGDDSRQRSVTVGGFFSSAIFGTFLDHFGITTLIGSSLFGVNDSAGEIIRYQGDLGNAYLNNMATSILVIVSAIGTFAIFKAILEFKLAGDGNNGQGGHDRIWAGIWHFLGGSFCINLWRFLN